MEHRCHETCFYSPPRPEGVFAARAFSRLQRLEGEGWGQRRGFAQLVAAELPKPSTRARKLGDSLQYVLRVHRLRAEGAREVPATVPPVRYGGVVQPGRFFGLKIEAAGAIAVGATRSTFRGGGAPNTPTCALKLGDRTSLTDVAREILAGLRHAHSSSAAAPLVRYGRMVWPAPCLPGPRALFFVCQNSVRGSKGHLASFAFVRQF